MTSIDFKKTSIADARRELDGEPKQSDERLLRYHRAHQENNILLNTTLTWMTRLPKGVRPMVLAARFPRIANRIAELWRLVARCEEYFDTLLVDRRGHRKGFPPEVAQELSNLRSFYAELHPDNHDSGWNRIDARY